MDEKANTVPVEKKPYEAPAVTRVHLVIKNAVLAACHSSPNLAPKSAPDWNCKVATGCYVPPA